VLLTGEREFPAGYLKRIAQVFKFLVLITRTQYPMKSDEQSLNVRNQMLSSYQASFTKIRLR